MFPIFIRFFFTRYNDDDDDDDDDDNIHIDDDDNDDDIVVHDVIQTFRSNTEAEATCCFLFSKIEC